MESHTYIPENFSIRIDFNLRSEFTGKILATKLTIQFSIKSLSLTDPVKHKSNLQKQIIPEAKCILQITDPN